MCRFVVAFVFLLLPLTSLADEAPKADLVLLPRDVAMAALNWLAEPNAGVAVKLYATLQACIQDNPPVTQKGGDQCPVVTQVIAAREKELVDLRKELADLKAKPEKAK